MPTSQTDCDSAQSSDDSSCPSSSGSEDEAVGACEERVQSSKVVPGVYVVNTTTSYCHAAVLRRWQVWQG